MQRAPFSRPKPGSAALPGYWHARKGCSTLLTPAMASARPCRTSCLGWSESRIARFYISLALDLRVHGMFHRRCSNLWPCDQIIESSQLGKVPNSGATIGAFLCDTRGLRSCT
eukprot:357033-Chlamydomonas_euryale.AAC.10